MSTALWFDLLMVVLIFPEKSRPAAFSRPFSQNGEDISVDLVKEQCLLFKVRNVVREILKVCTSA